MKADRAGGTVTTGTDQSRAFDVSALYVDGRSANVYGRVNGVGSVGAALEARRDSGLPEGATADDFKINDCTIGTACPEPEPEPETPFDIPSIVLIDDDLLEDENLTTPVERFSGQKLVLFFPSARIVGEEQEVFSNSGNEEIW